jgi:hypothetical protein
MFEPRSGQTKDYKIGICYFSTKHAVLRRKSKDWLARNQDNVPEYTLSIKLYKRYELILRKTKNENKD